MRVLTGPATCCLLVLLMLALTAGEEHSKEQSSLSAALGVQTTHQMQKPEPISSHTTVFTFKAPEESSQQSQPLLTKKTRKLHNGSEICSQSNTVPVPCEKISHNYLININSSNPCVFNCSYNPLQMSPIRFEVHQKYKHPTQHPTFVSIQQTFYINSWTLPILFPVSGRDQIFTSLETLLCPPANVGKEVLTFAISVNSADKRELQIGLQNVSLVLEKNDNVSVKVSPVSPWYKRYLWTPFEESVLVTAESFDGICALLVLHDAQCPMSSTPSTLRDRGRYQTFTHKAGMVAHRTEFPNGVHVVVISLPDDDSCILNPSGSMHNSSHVSRTKTVVLKIYDHATIASTWYIFLMTAGVITVLVIGITIASRVLITRVLTDNKVVLHNDERNLLEEPEESLESRGYRVEVGAGAVFSPVPDGSLPHSPHASRGGIPPENNLEDEGDARDGILGSTSENMLRQSHLAIDNQGEEGGSYNDNRAVLPVQPSFLPATTYSPLGEAMNLSQTFNPRFVWWWKKVALYEAKTAEAQVSEVGFQNSLIIMAVFAALPTTELLRSYLTLMLHHGLEDQCFFNSRCLTAFGSLPDFARVFTNLGYVLLGAAFIFIVRHHKILTQDILKDYNANNSVGVSRHYGLFYSLGFGLVIQGVMSALYHTCPNSVTLKFDMMFMYVLMAVAMVSIWGLRHGDITHHVYPTVIAVGLTLMLAELRMWLSRTWFWVILSALYTIILISNAVLMSTCGIWSFSLPKLWQAWKGWKPVARKVKEVLGEQNHSPRPMFVLRLVCGLLSNMGLILYGSLADPNVYNFVLVVCLTNMGLYFANYVLAKTLAFKEKGTILGWVSLASSLFLWTIALAFFYQGNTDSENSPAASRAKNSPCDFFLVYDEHDVWHVTSAFALFFFFVSLLTLDDDLCRKPSRKINVA